MLANLFFCSSNRLLSIVWRIIKTHTLLHDWTKLKFTFLVYCLRKVEWFSTLRSFMLATVIDHFGTWIAYASITTTTTTVFTKCIFLVLCRILISGSVRNQKENSLLPFLKQCFIIQQLIVIFFALQLTKRYFLDC